MKNSEFWVLMRKNMEPNDSGAGHYYPGPSLPPLYIVELTSDEIVYLWPSRPQFDSLCLVCSHLTERFVGVCKSNVPAGYPCQFQAVPEAEMNQDFDDFLIDGEYIAECGCYYSFNDFIRQNNYTDEDYMFYRLGTFASIRNARQEFIHIYNQIMPYMK